jgi:hypothetical protein
MSKKLHKQIEKKLETLQELLNKITEAQVINPDEPDTWDPDTLYNLVEKCKEVIKLLEDKKSELFNISLTSREKMITETGLCSLVDEYHSEEDE